MFNERSINDSYNCYGYYSQLIIFYRNNSVKNGEYTLEMFISIATVIESQNVPWISFHYLEWEQQRDIW